MVVGKLFRVINKNLQYIQLAGAV